MLTDEELFEKCGTTKPITCEDLGLPPWRSDTDGFTYECGGYTFYKTKDGYRHCTGELVLPFLRWWYGLN